MPYRIDLDHPPPDALDRLVDLGALDVETLDGRLAALLPDSIEPASLPAVLGVPRVDVSAAVGRDEGSIWLLRPRPVSVAGWTLVPVADVAATGPLQPTLPGDVIQLIDSPAFGTGLHPTTALCLELLDECLDAEPVTCALDVGTGSGVLAIAALKRGVAEVTGLDVDEEALRVAGRNALLNGVGERLHLRAGDLESLAASAPAQTWPLVFANILAAPLIEMAPQLGRRLGHRGRLILSGIPESVAPDVERAYRHGGLRPLDARTRGRWTALVLGAGW